jgi:hypothetical protein
MSEETQEFIDDAVDSNEAADEIDQPDDYDNGDAEQEQEEEEEELDVGDKKLRVPKSIAEILKAERLMKADYTRKTQGVAEDKRTLETQQAQHQEQVKAHQTHLKEVAAILSIDETLDQYSKVDWDALSESDPIEAQKHFMKYQQLGATRTAAVQKLQEAEQKTAFDAQQSRAKQLEDANAVLSRDIKGWSPEVATKLHEFAIKDLGFTPQEMGQVTDPRIVKLLHQAYVGASLSKKQEAPKAAPAKPATVIKGNAPVRKDPSKMTDKEFNAYMRRETK